jgi:hypothetical protein
MHKRKKLPDILKKYLAVFLKRNSIEDEITKRAALSAALYQCV